MSEIESFGGYLDCVLSNVVSIDFP